ncbi:MULTISPECIES: type I polyketide synthase [unclassified Actinopolyspora]|uniref:SDR family NAD(P)-dependent oxidoreductase n=1 Tax=unclassified Actinopolyspora TaxID=2639451 RepID=UPI0013F67823|nr:MULTISPECIES: type I polyketide synthase [unclassified Actinopolyspora]NHD15970.1 SDR family NAD(P)-dependent oxidoreductase [Actinopolyspora sp. BKK2]NHE74816.1 SDR family NAD(P)-dependent oxidoreductase [Actinopolyspora sp. BKK1]
MPEDGSTGALDYRAKLGEALDTIAKLREALRKRASEPIAIVGAGHRFPGSANTPDGLWRLLREGGDAIGDFPVERWDTGAYYHPDPDHPGTTSVLRGGYLDEVYGFDPQLFGISPAEAVGMDPQQRIALEVAWETFERAGEPVLSLNGSRTGVYIGASTDDYVRLRQQFGTPESVDGYQIFGEPSFIAGRISHTFGLQGPAQVIDTACSSSLVALHQACRALRAGDVDLALAGGVNLLLSPYGFVLVDKAGAASPRGRCATFDASADGYVRAEGCGMVLLKRLDKALSDGDEVLAVIRGSAVNHDGRASGVSVPNPAAQRAVIGDALTDAGIEPAEVDYVEAHGTGTALGDPIELNSLHAVLGADRGDDDPLLVGSVKTNMGHLEAAAGVAGLMKVVLALRNREIPPHPHFEEPNPNIDWASLRVRVPVVPTPWPSRERRARAGLSSFGASGTNAHLVLEEPAPAEIPGGECDEREAGPHLLTLSGRGEGAVRELAGRFSRAVRETPPEQVPGLCRAAAERRSHHGYRMAVVSDDAGRLADALDAAAKGADPTEVQHGRAVAAHRAGVAFVFPGQGAQYAGMGRELYRDQPVFRQALLRCCELMDPSLPRPLRDVLFDAGGDSELNETRYTQPALFAVEYALSELMRSWGVTPSVVLGHSIGEYTAACVSGALDLPDAARLVVARAGLMQRIDRPGAMISVTMSESEAFEVLAERQDSVSVAAVNGPDNVVLAGDSGAIDALGAELAARGTPLSRLRVSHAFHSPLIEPVLPELTRAAEQVPVREPGIPLISNLTGGVVGFRELSDPEYWARHARGTVRFADGVRAVSEYKPAVCVETGPGRGLRALGERCLGDSAPSWATSLRRADGEVESVFGALARLHVAGAPVDLSAVHEGIRPHGGRLPSYPFQHQRLTFPVARVAPTGAEPVDTGDRQVDYRLRWREVPPPRGSERSPQRLLVFVDDGEFATDLLHGIAERGDERVLVRRGDRFRRLSDDEFELPTGDPTAVRQLSERTGSFDQVLYLWPLSRATVTEAEKSDPALADRARDDFVTVLELLRSFGESDDSAPRVRVVDRGEPGESDGPVLGLGAAPLAGLGQVAALERPESWGGVLDLDPRESPGAGVSRLLDELGADTDDDQVAYRDGQRLVPRLVPDAPPSGSEALVRGDGTYLITGGLGGLGRAIARWLVERGARRLVLTGRRGLPDRSEWDSGELDESARAGVALVRDLEEAGASVSIRAADTADETAMAEVLASIPETAPLRGVVHAAGTAGAQLIEEIDTETAVSVMKAKVDGSWVLHRLLGETPLDFLVLMSSIASVWGSSDLAAYAAANAFLDRLAAHRRSRGLPGVSINWGPWEVDSGLGGEELLDYLRSTGLRPLSARTGLDRFAAALAGPPRRVVADVDWTVLAGLLQSKRKRPLLEDVEAGEPDDTGDEGRSEVLTAVLETDDSERESLLDDYVRNRIAEQLGVDRNELTDDADLVELGMDSLAVMRVLGHFRTDLRLTLAPRPFFVEPAVRWGDLLAEEITQQFPDAAE